MRMKHDIRHSHWFKTFVLQFGLLAFLVLPLSGCLLTEALINRAMAYDYDGTGFDYGPLKATLSVVAQYAGAAVGLCALTILARRWRYPAWLILLLTLIGCLLCSIALLIRHGTYG